VSSEADEEAFLAALARDPDDEASRQVYADFLEDRGETARAEYLRAEAAWFRLTRRYAAIAANVDRAWLEAIARPRAVVLVRVTGTALEVIREVRRAKGCDLATAKEIVDDVRAGKPRAVVEGVDEAAAARVASYFVTRAETRIIVGSPRRWGFAP
jgi:uncharacterized protein (TIGR02996 family)